MVTILERWASLDALKAHSVAPHMLAVPGAGQGSCRGCFAESVAQGVAPYKTGGIATPQDSKGILDQGLQEIRGETQSRVPA